MSQENYGNIERRRRNPDLASNHTCKLPFIGIKRRRRAKERQGKRVNCGVFSHMKNPYEVEFSVVKRRSSVQFLKASLVSYVYLHFKSIEGLND